MQNIPIGNVSDNKTANLILKAINKPYNPSSGVYGIQMVARKSSTMQASDKSDSGPKSG